MPQQTVVTTYKGETFTLPFNLPRSPTRAEIDDAASQAWSKKHMVAPLVGLGAGPVTVAPQVSTPVARKQSSATRRGASAPKPQGNPMYQAGQALDGLIPGWRDSKHAPDIYRALGDRYRNGDPIDDGLIGSIVKGMAALDPESIKAQFAKVGRPNLVEQIRGPQGVPTSVPTTPTSPIDHMLPGVPIGPMPGTVTVPPAAVGAIVKAGTAHPPVNPDDVEAAQVMDKMKGGFDKVMPDSRAMHPGMSDEQWINYQQQQQTQHISDFLSQFDTPDGPGALGVVHRLRNLYDPTQNPTVRNMVSSLIPQVMAEQQMLDSGQTSGTQKLGATTNLAMILGLPVHDLVGPGVNALFKGMFKGIEPAAKFAGEMAGLEHPFNPINPAVEKFPVKPGLDTLKGLDRLKGTAEAAIGRPLTAAEHAVYDQQWGDYSKLLDEHKQAVGKAVAARLRDLGQMDPNVAGKQTPEATAARLAGLKRGLLDGSANSMPLDQVAKTAQVLLEHIKSGSTFEQAVKDTAGFMQGAGHPVTEGDVMNAVFAAGRPLEQSGRGLGPIKAAIDEAKMSADLIGKANSVADRGIDAHPEDFAKPPPEIVSATNKEFVAKRDALLARLEEAMSGPKARAGDKVEWNTPQRLEIEGLRKSLGDVESYWNKRAKFNDLQEAGHIDPNVDPNGMSVAEMDQRIALGDKLKGLHQQYRDEMTAIMRGEGLPEKTPKAVPVYDEAVYDIEKKIRDQRAKLGANRYGLEWKSLKDEFLGGDGWDKVLATGKMALKTASHANDVSRSMVASIDQSGLLTQGRVAIMNPELWWPWLTSAKKGIGSIWTDEGAIKQMRSVENSPEWKVGQHYGLHLNSVVDPLASHEDVFGSDIINYYAGLGGVGKWATAPIRASDRSLSAFVTNLRLKTFTTITDMNGGWKNMTPEQLKTAAEFANNLTSRASGALELGGKTVKASDIADLLGKVYFSGHHTLSGPQVYFQRPLEAIGGKTGVGLLSPKTKRFAVRQHLNPLVLLGLTDTALRATGRGYVDFDFRSPEACKVVTFDPDHPDNATVTDIAPSLTMWYRTGALAYNKATGQGMSNPNTGVIRSIGTVDVPGASGTYGKQDIDRWKLEANPEYQKFLEEQRALRPDDPHWTPFSGNTLNSRLPINRFSIPHIGDPTKDRPDVLWQPDTSKHEKRDFSTSLLQTLVINKLQPLAGEVADKFFGNFNNNERSAADIGLRAITPITPGQAISTGTIGQRTLQAFADQIAAMRRDDRGNLRPKVTQDALDKMWEQVKNTNPGGEVSLKDKIRNVAFSALGGNQKETQLQDYENLIRNLRDPQETDQITMRDHFPKDWAQLIEWINVERKGRSKIGAKEVKAAKNAGGIK